MGQANTIIPTAEEKRDAGFDVDSLSEWLWLPWPRWGLILRRTDRAENRFFQTCRDTAFICETPECHFDNMASKHFQRIAAPGESSQPSYAVQLLPRSTRYGGW